MQKQENLRRQTSHMDTTVIVYQEFQSTLYISPMSNQSALSRWTVCVRKVNILVAFIIGPNISAKITEKKSSVHSRTVSGFNK